MEIKQAAFVVSNTQVAKCPTHKLPEYAFIGRSNVGKSSLINMLTNHRGLAKTSSKPGKTQLINHFLINKEWYLVDLPGYGYAKVSNAIPFAIVFTKADKLTEKQIQEHVASYSEILLQQWEEMPPYFITSSENRLGKEDLLSYIETINQSLKA